MCSSPPACLHHGVCSPTCPAAVASPPSPLQTMCPCCVTSPAHTRVRKIHGKQRTWLSERWCCLSQPHVLSRVGGLPQLCLSAPDDRLDSRVLVPLPTLRPGPWLSPPPWSPQEWPSLGGDWECWGRGRRDLSQARGKGINLLLLLPTAPHLSRHHLQEASEAPS